MGIESVSKSTTLGVYQKKHLLTGIYKNFTAASKVINKCKWLYNDEEFEKLVQIGD